MPIYYRGYKITYIKSTREYYTELHNTSVMNTKQIPLKIYSRFYFLIKIRIRRDILSRNPQLLIPRFYMNFKKKGGKI